MNVVYAEKLEKLNAIASIYELTQDQQHRLDIKCARLEGIIEGIKLCKPKPKSRCPHRFIDRTKCKVCDPAGCLKHQVGLNTWHAIKGDEYVKLDKDGNIPYVGCTPEFLREHLNKTMPACFTWDDWGKNTFHIDHIVAIKKYEPIPWETTIARFHWSNLQILHAKDNIRKGNK